MKMLRDNHAHALCTLSRLRWIISGPSKAFAHRRGVGSGARQRFTVCLLCGPASGWCSAPECSGAPFRAVHGGVLLRSVQQGLRLRKSS